MVKNFQMDIFLTIANTCTLVIIEKTKSKIGKIVKKYMKGEFEKMKMSMMMILMMKTHDYIK